MKFRDICTIVTGINNYKVSNEQGEGMECFPIIKPENIQTNQDIDLEVLDRVWGDAQEIKPVNFVKPLDIVVQHKGTIFKAAVFYPDAKGSLKQKVLVHSSCMILRLHEMEDIEQKSFAIFLTAYLNSSQFKNSVVERHRSGFLMITKKKLLETGLSFPLTTEFLKGKLELIQQHQKLLISHKSLLDDINAEFEDILLNRQHS